MVYGDQIACIGVQAWNMRVSSQDTNTAFGLLRYFPSAAGGAADVDMGMELSPHSMALRGDRHGRAGRQAGQEVGMSTTDAGTRYC